MALTDWGALPLGTVIPIMWSSHDAATGANEAMSGLAVTDIEVYKGVSMTQRASDAGYVLLDTDGIDIDSIVGANGVSIDTGDNTDAGFFAAGSLYNVWIGAVTIDGQTVNIHAATFRIVLAETVAGEPKVDVGAWLGTAAATPTVAGVPEVDLTHIAGSVVSTSTAQLGVNAVQAGATAWGSGAITAASIAADAITAAKIAAGAIDAATFAASAIDATAIATGAITAAKFAAGAIDAAAIATDAIGAAELADGAITAATFAAGAIDAAAIAADFSTENNAAVIALLPAALVGGRMDASVGAMAANVMTAAAAAADLTTELQAGLATAAALTTVDDFLDTEIAALTLAVQGIVPVNGTIGATGNDTTHLHIALAYADDAINSMLLTIKDVSTGLFYSRWIEDFANTGDLVTVATLPFTPEASVDLYWLTPVRSDVTGGSGLDAAGVRAAVGLASANLDTQLGDLPTNAELATSQAAADDATLAILGTPAGASMSADIAAVKVDTAAILVDTATIDTPGEIAAAVWGADATTYQTQGTFGQAIGDPVADTNTLFKAVVTDAAGATVGVDIVAVKTETASIQTDTNDLQVQVGTAGAGLTAADDAVMTRLGAPAGASISADIAAIEAQTDDIGAAGVGLTAVPWNAAWDAEVQSEAADAITAAGLATAAALDTVDNLLDTEIPALTTSVAAIKVVTDALPNAGALTSLATQASVTAIDDLLDSEMPALTTAVADLPTNAELATALGTADDAILSAIAALNNLSSAQVGTAVFATAATEAYRANGATATLAQFMYEVLAHLGEASVAGVTKTTKKLDHAATAATFTLDSGTNPTSVTRAT